MNTVVTFTFTCSVCGGTSLSELQSIWHAMADKALELGPVDKVNLNDGDIACNPDDSSSCGAAGR